MTTQLIWDPNFEAAEQEGYEPFPFTWKETEASRMKAGIKPAVLMDMSKITEPPRTLGIIGIGISAFSLVGIALGILHWFT